MQQMEFSPEEIEVLREVLQHELTEMEVEVFRTDVHDFKQMLKHRRTVLEQVLNKISIVPASN